MKYQYYSECYYDWSCPKNTTVVSIYMCLGTQTLDWKLWKALIRFTHCVCSKSPAQCPSYSVDVFSL